MNPSATTGTSISTLSDASVKSAEGNDFMTIGHSMVKLENVNNLTINTHCATEDGASEVKEDLSSGLIAIPNVFVTLATLLIGGIFGRKASETHPICSENTPQQLTPEDGARDQLEPTAGATEVQDITASAPLAVLDTVNSTISPSTQSSPSERYIRSLSEYIQGYPLYEPELESHEEGIRVGDVGLITEDGGFDFLFNVCPPSDTNPNELPDDFEMLGSPEIQVKAHFQSDTHLFNKEVKRIEEPDIKYTCSGPEGGVLELPLGATRFEAKNKRSFKKLATFHAENWYRYAVLTKEKEASNGSMYVVTACIKCTDWGIAVFDRPSNDQDYLRFITNEENQNERSKYKWKGSGAFIPKVSLNRGSAGSDETAGPNQCVFLRGYKIMLPGDIWDNITNSEFTGTSSVRVSPDSPHSGNKSELPRQGDSRNRDGPEQSRADSGSGSDCGTNRATQNTCSRTNTSVRVILSEYSKPSPAHPSDLINAMLLYQEPKAKVALTHDDDWCGLLQYHSRIPDSGAIAKVSLPYTSNVDEYGCASLKRSDLSHNVIVEESSSDTCVTSTLENHLPTDSGDNLAGARQDYWHPVNTATRASTPHSQYSHHSISSTTATVRSDCNGAFACGQSSQASEVHGHYPYYPTAGAGSSEHPASPRKVLPYTYDTGSDGLILAGTHAEEEYDETSEHDYTSSQEPADIELDDAADKFQLLSEGDKFSRLGDNLRLTPKPAKGVGGPSTTSTATDQLDKPYQSHSPFDRNKYPQLDVVDFSDFDTFWNINDPSSQSSSVPSASGPPVIKLEDVENDLRAVGSQRIRQAAGRRRKRDDKYQCSFRTCQATFTTRASLRYHINRHLDLKPYKCDKCPFAAASPGTVSRHRTTCKPAEQRVIPQSLDS